MASLSTTLLKATAAATRSTTTFMPEALRKSRPLFEGSQFRPYYSASNSSPSARESRLEQSFFKPKLVIFDKDGTLVCFHTMWSPWCTTLANKMQLQSGRDLSESLFDVLGYCSNTERVRIGSLAENTHPQIKEEIHDMLTSDAQGFSEDEAHSVIESSWTDTPENMRIKTTGDLQQIFSDLKDNRIKIAICTSDSREGTFEFLEREDLSNLVDMVVCGDDPHGKPKPNPHNAHYICRELGVRPADTIMVGDTPADTLMGQKAKLGLTVGVLSGVGDKEDLADADVIVNDVTHCVDMILKPVNGRIHQVTQRGLFKIANGGGWLSPGMAGRQTGGRGQTRAFSTATTPAAERAGEYSHVIVGAGSAGCVLANRLTEDRKE